ncbi:very short patch repair endonuclease [Arthrobacter zhaoxinii]|uniref:very short patch repair endonuclease n=1 Tax=Arthrobacter zhaoxinii TaxID=2964616 RepID=UPI00210327A9|nr:very short patch repair endonuclease [Arthrobacter zhaoxinii]MCQ2001475.1 very short patch repair endonuclease [Arthrobacter zhaoxinii]
MADFMDPGQRSAHMAKIKSKNTKPELLLRKGLHALGYRYRLHERKLPGKPDLVFPSRKKVVFVNGCFWHGHDCPVGSRLPKTNTEFWRDKRAKNQARDEQQLAQLDLLGWESLVVWECDIKASQGVPAAVTEYLGGPAKAHGSAG